VPVRYGRRGKNMTPWRRESKGKAGKARKDCRRKRDLVSSGTITMRGGTIKKPGEKERGGGPAGDA